MYYLYELGMYYLYEPGTIYTDVLGTIYTSIPPSDELVLIINNRLRWTIILWFWREEDLPRRSWWVASR